MAENDAMEGKDLAIKEKQQFEEKILESIKDLKTGESIVTIGEIQISKSIGGYTMSLKEIDFGIIDEKGNFTYNKENFAEIKKALEEEGITLEELGLPDIEEWIDEQEQEQQKDELEKDEPEKDERDLSDDMEEKEEEPEREGHIDEQKEEIARRYKVSPNQVVHISTGTRAKRITDKENFAGLAKWSEKYDDIFILPGEDEYSWQTIGVDKEGKEEIINNRQVEGKNPDATIKIEDERSENKGYKEVRPLAMYEIDSHEAYAIVRDSAGKTQAIYCRQEEGKGKEYWGQVIPEAQGKNVREASADSREAISHEHYSSYDLAERGTEFEKAKSLEERGFPSKEGEGVQLKEIEGTQAQNRQLAKEAIIRNLADRAIAASPMPIVRAQYIKIHQNELNAKAEKVLTLGEKDADITYETAIEKVETEQQGKDEDEKIPRDNPRRRQH